MSETEWRDNEISLFAVGSTLLRHRWRIARWMIFGGAVAALIVFRRPPTYRASASFIPAGADAGRSALAGLASQLGVASPSSNPSSSPEFYEELLKSPALLQQIVRDTFVVQELGGKAISFHDLFRIQQGTSKFRADPALDRLAGAVDVSVSRNTGIVRVSVTTEWPSASVAIVAALVQGVDEFNRRTRQSQAAAERKFVEERLSVAANDLRAAENRMQAFLQTNRQIGTSPELAFERERIQRNMMLQQQVFTSLTQSYQEVRLREVRDTPVITLFEGPSVPARPEARGRLKAGLLGLAIGAFIGVVLAFGSEMIARTRLGGSPDADEFVGKLKEVQGEMLRPVRWVTGRGRR